MGRRNPNAQGPYRWIEAEPTDLETPFCPASACNSEVHNRISRDQDHEPSTSLVLCRYRPPAADDVSLRPRWQNCSVGRQSSALCRDESLQTLSSSHRVQFPPVARQIDSSCGRLDLRRENIA